MSDRFFTPHQSDRFQDIISGDSNVLKALPRGESLDERFANFAHEIGGIILPAYLRESLDYGHDIEAATGTYALAARKNVLLRTDPDLRAFVDIWEYEETQIHARALNIILANADFSGPNHAPAAVRPAPATEPRSSRLASQGGKFFEWTQKHLSGSSEFIARAGVGIISTVGKFNEYSTREFYAHASADIPAISTAHQRVRRVLGAMSRDEYTKHAQAYDMMAKAIYEGPHGATHQRIGRFVLSKAVSAVGVGTRSQYEFDDVIYNIAGGDTDELHSIADFIDSSVLNFPGFEGVRAAHKMLVPSFNRAALLRQAAPNQAA